MSELKEYQPVKTGAHRGRLFGMPLGKANYTVYRESPLEIGGKESYGLVEVGQVKAWTHKGARKAASKIK